MRIETIALSNFGSYADAMLDLRDVSAAVIVGVNGAGKSTLVVDSVLWALFGQCRTDTDAMMKIGATVMTVSVQFGLNGQTYRITRTRSKQTKAGKSELSVLVLNGDEWVSNSGANLTATQQKIHDLLNADYSLFTSTGYLLQGQADRFSRATASERKAILAQILRLDQYSLLKQAAGRKANDCQVRIVEKDERVQALKNTALDVEQLQADLGNAQTRQVFTEAELRANDCNLDALKTELATLQAKQAGLAALEEQQSGLETKLTALKSRQMKADEQRTRLEKILSNRQAIESKVVELEELEKDETALNLATNAATEDAQLIGKRIQDVQAEVQVYLTQKSERQSRIDKLTGQLKEKVSGYQQDTARIEDALKRDRQASDLLATVPCSTELQGQCQFTLQAVQAQGLILPAELSLSTRQTVTADIQSAVGAELLREIDHLRGELDAMQTKQPGSEIDALKAKQAECGAKLKTLQNDRQRVFTAIQTAKKFTVLMPELLASEQVLAKTQEELSALAADIAVVGSDLQSIKLQCLDALTSGNEVREATAKVTALHGERSANQARLQSIGEEIGRVTAGIESAKRALVEIDALTAERTAIHADMRLYATLAEAYQKIPVLIMENAIPMLEHEANSVLKNISTSGLHVHFDTQKALKSRDGLAETLDIRVRDVFGERLLENFSGGERARVDLCIRIGLSKMLARRSGSRLETLVVDEAFAAIDREGMDQVIECLPVLSKEFSLCLFISHDEGFKNSLPQQIVITKDSSGSKVEVIQ